MTPLNPREKKIVAAGLAAGLLILILFGVVLPIVQGFFDRANDRRDQLEEYARNSRLIGNMRLWRAALSDQRKTSGLYAFTATNENNGSEQLKEKLKQIIVASGGALVTIDDAASGPGRVRAGVRVKLTADQLIECVRKIEDGPPLMQIDGLKIDAGDASSPGQTGNMDIQIDVSAYYNIATQ